nr:type VI secretion system tube protein Hcp [uncultured Roseateles sp.]
MKLTGSGAREIAGESEAEGFERQIEVDDWSWSVATTTTKKSVGGSTSSSAPRTNDANLVGSRPPAVSQEETTTDPSVFSFSKMMDRSSTAMMHAMTSGELLSAIITMEESSEAEFEVEIELNRVRVIDYKVTGKNDKASGEIEEKWVFNYSDIAFHYLPTTHRGKLTASMSRSADAPIKGTDKETELLDLAAKFELPALEALWPKMKEKAAQKAKPVDETKPG